MLKKWFIEKCCFTYYCTVQLYKIVLKAWKQSALEHLQHPVLRQPSTWDGRVGEAALLSYPRWSWQREKVSHWNRTSAQRAAHPCGAARQRERKLPPLESVSPGVGASISTKEELHFCAFLHTGRNTLLTSASTLEPWQFLKCYL